tara:strand:- start:395 stop:532 length:138 start_codon:yes stop_codon:yes gene_type:complete
LALLRVTVVAQQEVIESQAQTQEAILADQAAEAAPMDLEQQETEL